MDYLLKNTDLRPINKTLESLFSYINYYKPLNKMKVLEIGIGNGNASIPMSTKFKSYYGIEPLKDIYDIFIEMCKKHKCIIKSYNMNLEDFTNNTKIKFDMIILRNVIHFIGYDELIKQSKKILLTNGFIIIQNAQAKPIGWGNKQFVEESNEFNQEKWCKFKNQLDICYNTILHSKYLIKFDKDNKYNFFILRL